MNIIFQDRFPVRTIVLIGVALLITTQIYAAKCGRPTFADTTKRHIERIRQTDWRIQPDILLSTVRKLP